MDRGAWWATVHRITKSQTRLNAQQHFMIFLVSHDPVGASLVAQMVKNLPAMKETWVQSLGWEDPLEKEWQTTPVFLPRESHGQRSLANYSPM